MSRQVSDEIRRLTDRPLLEKFLGQHTPAELRRLARELEAEADRREAALAGRRVRPGVLRVVDTAVTTDTFCGETSVVARLIAEDGKYRYTWTARWWVDVQGARGVGSEPNTCERQLLNATRPGGVEAGSWSAHGAGFRKAPPARLWALLARRAEAVWKATPPPRPWVAAGGGA